MGQELVFTDDLAKALSCFRTALRFEPRLYNAWYGLGMVYSRQEKHDLAEVHFHKVFNRIFNFA
jgi:anaphase-promoting complex subunit 3